MAGAAAGVWGLLEAASDANETMSALKVVFKENSDAVTDWSKKVGKEMGRSEYAFQKSAQQFGAFMSPIFKDTGADITDMSQRLSELSVDLASFYNTSDEEAQMRLFSGLSGETEAVRRLGIDISDSSLKEMHQRRGGKGQYKSLSMAEKTQLRYLKILEDTINAQGQAVRESKQWAGTIKAIRGRWQSFTVELGRTLEEDILPLARKFLELLPRLEKLISKSSALETAFQMLAIGAGSLAVAWAALNAPLAGMTILLGAAVALLEDYNTFVDGGRSVMGEFIQAVTDSNKPLQEWTNLQQGIIGGFDVLVSAVVDVAELIYGAFSWLGGSDPEVEMGFDTARNAWKRASQRANNETGVQAGFDAQNLAFAASGDFKSMRKDMARQGQTLSDAEFFEMAKGFRTKAIEQRLAAPTDQDVATGFISQAALDAYNKSSHSLVGTDELAGKVQRLDTQNISIVVNAKSNDPKGIADEMAVKLRQAKAALKEDR